MKPTSVLTHCRKSSLYIRERIDNYSINGRQKFPVVLVFAVLRFCFRYPVVSTIYSQKVLCISYRPRLNQLYEKECFRKLLFRRFVEFAARVAYFAYLLSWYHGKWFDNSYMRGSETGKLYGKRENLTTQSEKQRIVNPAGGILKWYEYNLLSTSRTGLTDNPDTSRRHRSLQLNAYTFGSLCSEFGAICSPACANSNEQIRVRRAPVEHKFFADLSV